MDISSQMLNILKKKAEKKKINNIKTHCAGFLTYQPEEEVEIDKIVSIAALHHLPDFWKSIALLRMAQILKPLGRLYLHDVIFTFNVLDYEQAIERLIKNMKAAAGDSMVEETIIHVREEFSTYDWIMEGLLERSGFSIDSQLKVDENFITYICTKL